MALYKLGSSEQARENRVATFKQSYDKLPGFGKAKVHALDAKLRKKFGDYEGDVVVQVELLKGIRWHTALNHATISYLRKSGTRVTVIPSFTFESCIGNFSQFVDERFTKQGSNTPALF